MVAVIVVAIGVGLGSALVLNRAFKGRTLARALMTMPWSFPDVPTVLIFLWMLNPIVWRDEHFCPVAAVGQ